MCPHRSSAQCQWKYLDEENSLKVDMKYYMWVVANSSDEFVFSNVTVIDTKYIGKMYMSTKYPALDHPSLSRRIRVLSCRR